MMLLFFLVTACSLLAPSSSYNVDTSFPIVYEYPRERSGRSSYFGMSTLIRPRAADCSNEWVIQVGAPRGNMSNLNSEPGTVLRCKLHGPCRLLTLDRINNQKATYNGIQYTDKKIRSWIGVSMAASHHSHSQVETTVVCGHRWLNENRKTYPNTDITYPTIGVCYSQKIMECGNESNVNKLLPLLNLEMYTQTEGRTTLYYWGLGEAGLSADLSVRSDGSDRLLLGAPGLVNFGGGFVEYHSLNPSTSPDVTDFHKALRMRKFYYNVYNGYQVVVGQFFDEKEWYVTSAPRAQGLTGEVTIFLKVAGKITKTRSEGGAMFGEYFGASLAVADVNGDGNDDLIVGAPFNSEKVPDGGRIQVLLGKDKADSLVWSTELFGSEAFGRFGTSIGAVGDLDQDGYDDLAVGAPYEHSRRGAVYIYRGSSSGLSTMHSQRFLAEDVDTQLRGFGVSISRGVDIDGNFFKDFTVGAYLSEQVVLFRTHPVVKLEPTITFQSNFLDRAAKDFNIQVCIEYTGPPPSISVFRSLQIDPERRRVSFPTTRSWADDQQVQINEKQANCENFTLALSIPDETRADAFTNLKVTLKTELTPCRQSEGTVKVTSQGGEKRVVQADKFDKWCAVGDKMDVTKDLIFHGECGEDQVCQSDLKLDCELQNTKGKFVLGTSNEITLSMNISNDGEPAHETDIVVEADRKIKREEDEGKTPVQARNLGTSLPYRYPVSDVDSTIVHGTQKNAKFAIDATMIGNGKSEMKLRVEATTSSQEVNKADNVCYLSLQLESQIQVQLQASASNTSISVQSDQAYVVFAHYYEVKQEGVSSLRESQLEIQLPKFLGDSAVQLVTVDYQAAHMRYLSEEGLGQNGRSHKAGSPTGGTLYLNCTKWNFVSNCSSFKFNHNVKSKAPAYVKLIFNFTIPSIESYLHSNMEVNYTSTARLKATDLLGSTMGREASASTKLYSVASQVDMYIIILSVLAGGLVLSLIVSGLIRGDFFKRKTKEKLEALKTADIDDRINFEFLQNLEEEPLEDNGKH